MDPYVACSVLVDTVCLDSKMFGDLARHYDQWRFEHNISE